VYGINLNVSVRGHWQKNMNPRLQDKPGMGVEVYAKKKWTVGG
jgi:hypothetical protein